MSVERSTVAGVGVIGRGIAHAGALAGFEVRLRDADAGALEKTRETAERMGKQTVEIYEIPGFVTSRREAWDG